MIDNHTSLFNSHTSKTSTNQNAQSNSINNHTQGLSRDNNQIRRKEFVEPKPRSQVRHHQAIMESTFPQVECKVNQYSKSSKNAANTDSLDKMSGVKNSNSIHSHNEKLLAAALDNNVLDYSPFNFLQGINPRRLLKGRSLLGRASLVEALKCTFCNCVIVQGQECDNCEGNFCAPCIKQWEASDSAKIYSTPCKCQNNASLKHLNKLKQEYLNQIRFKCNNQRCNYQLTYDELLLGTHELDDCNFMNIVCEGCGMRIFKQDQIRHESIECSNPIGKCTFCQRIFGMSDMLAHRRECGQRSFVKVEYVNNPEVAANTTFNQSKFNMMEFDHRPDQDYRPNNSGGSSGIKSSSSRHHHKGSNESKERSSHRQQQVAQSPEKALKKVSKRGQRRTVVEHTTPAYVQIERERVEPSEDVYHIPVDRDGKANGQAQQSRRQSRGLGLISHTDNMSQVHGPHESVPPATQSTSRKENNTTGINYTQSSVHPMQSQKSQKIAEEQTYTHGEAKASKACIVIDDYSYSDKSPKEKFSSQPVHTQSLKHVTSKGARQSKEAKHRLRRRSRSRGGLDQEELFKEELAQRKESELLKHQTAVQESSSNIHLSELERSGPIHHTDQKPKASSKMIFNSDKKQLSRTRASRSKHHRQSHHRSSGISHLNPRKISVQSKRMTRQAAKNKPVVQESEVASSVLEYDMESCEVPEKQVQHRQREFEQIIAASSASNNRPSQVEELPISQTDSEIDMDDDEDEEEVSEVVDDQQESISMTSNSMVVQTCQNQLPPSIVSHGNYKNSHSDLNNAGQVRKMFQTGGTAKHAKKSSRQAAADAIIKQPSKNLGMRKVHHGHQAVEHTRRSSRHQH